MKVSLVIPVYNEEKSIGECLQFIEKQSTRPNEIIIVDNNSTDETLNKIHVFTHLPIRIVTEKKQGIICARDTGFNEARYEIIARCDADSKPPSDWIKKIIYNFENQDADALTGPISYYDLFSSSSLYARIFLSLMKIWNKGTDVLLGPNMAIRKNIWEKIKNNTCRDDLKVHEDTDLGIHLRQINARVIRDDTLVMLTSGRRIKKNPLSFFIEYPIRLLKTMFSH